MTEHLCSCGQPAPTSTLCKKCTRKLRSDLRALYEPRYGTSLAEDLDITLARQARFDDRADGSRSTTTPLVFNDQASEAGRRLRDVLTRWTRAILDRTPPPAPLPGPVCRDCRHVSCTLIRHVWWMQPPADTIAAMARWLHDRVDELARHDAGDQAADQIKAAVDRARAVVDMPPERVYAGPCLVVYDSGECRADVYAKPDSKLATCVRCGAHHDVDERRAQLAEAMEEQQVTATRAVLYLRLLGFTVSASAIRGYAHRNRLVAADHTVRGAVYRLGDILDILNDPDREAAS